MIDSSIDGILIIDKPRGPTSSDVVQQVRRSLKIDKVGHTGTLDPMATGVLPLCLGRATALAQILTAEDKRYLARVKLGARTDSGDAEGVVIEERPVPSLDEAGVLSVVTALVGPQLQTPPMVSAVRVAGQRLYELARKGIEVERAPRPIRLHALALREWTPTEIEFEVHCSKGTYVRVLGEELAARLGTVGHLTMLRRLASGRFDLSRALQVENLKGDLEERRRVAGESLLSMESALEDWTRVVVQGEEARGIAHGRVPRGPFPGPAGPRAIVDEAGKLLALAALDGLGQLTFSRVLVRS